MYQIDLTGQSGVVFGVANDHSIAWGIARLLGNAGATLALTYQNVRLKGRVDRLAGTMNGAITLPCDATDDMQIKMCLKALKLNLGTYPLSCTVLRMPAERIYQGHSRTLIEKVFALR